MEEFPENIYARAQKEKLEVFYDRMLETGIDTEVLSNFIQSMKSEGTYHHPKFKAIQFAIDNFKDGKYPGAASVPIDIHDAEALKFLGTIQGSPLSPYLSAIVIEELNLRLPTGVEVIKYADDMVFYGKELKQYVYSGMLESNLADVGLTLSKGESNASSNLKTQKTGWVKLDKFWLKELTFLGMTYNGILDQLRSNTRKGNTLIYNKQSLVDNLYDIEEILNETRESNIKKLTRYMNKAIRLTNISVINTIIRIPVVVDVIAYNIAQNMIEMIKMADASDRNMQIMKLIIFLRMIFSLPRRILFAIEIRELAKMKDKRKAIDFLKQVFEQESGEIKVELADDFMEPNDSTSMYNPFTILFHRTAPYLMKEGQEIGLYSRLKEGWQHGIRVEAIYKYSKPADKFIINQNLSMNLKAKIQVKNITNLTPEIFLLMVILGLFFHVLLILIPIIYVISNPKIQTIYEEKKVESVASKMKMRNYPENILVNNSPTTVGHPTSFKFNFPLYHWRTLFFTETNNKYLKKYRNKYQWQNLVNSSIAGILFSRLYSGNYSTQNITQDFTMKYKIGSMASKLVERNKDMNVFTGTSIAHYAMLRMLGRCTKHKNRFFITRQYSDRYPGTYFQNRGLINTEFYRILQILHLLDRVTEIPSMKATKFGTMAILRTKRFYSYSNNRSEAFNVTMTSRN
jgi:Na+-transporting methylmalonyl-CoA/oxaloacetate decarboxylase gamma subunit